MVYRYIYKITCTAGNFKNKFYFGQHTTKKLNDGYHGSSSILKRAKYFKNYPNDYIKDILFYCDSQNELNEKEQEIISKYINHEDCLNIAIGGLGHVGINPTYNMTEEQYKTYCKNISDGLKGHKISDETKRKISESHTGYKHTDLAKQHMKKTEEQKKKQHDKMVGKLAGEKNPNYGKTGINSYLYGRKWMNDTINECIIESEYWGEYVDIGFSFGRLTH